MMMAAALGIPCFRHMRAQDVPDAETDSRRCLFRKTLAKFAREIQGMSETVNRVFF